MTPPSAVADRFRRLVAPGSGGAGALSAPQLALMAAVAPGAGRPTPVLVRPAAPPAGGANPADITQAFLFGKDTPVAAEGTPAATNVSLVLAGTLAVRDPSQGLAIVGETAQNAKVYAVGAVVPGGRRLNKVYADHVLLEHDGVLETLQLPHPSGGKAGPLIAQASPAGNSGEPPLNDSVQRLIAQGPEVIGEVLRPMPTYVNGALKGFRVYPGRNRGKFEQLQLRAGDLVTAINNVPLSDPQRGMEILRTLGTGVAQVTVERGAVTQQIMIDASQVATLSQPGSDAPQPPGQPSAPQTPNPE